MGERWAAMLFVCWLLPLGLLGGVVLLGHAVRLGWRQRGLERGTLYCAGCRFNLTGCASWNCPECGAHLEDGRIITREHDPPVGLAGRLVLATVGVAGPLVFACWLVAWVVPVNWEVNRFVILTPTMEPQAEGQVTVYGFGERSWVGRGAPDAITIQCQSLYYHSDRSQNIARETTHSRFEMSGPDFENNILLLDGRAWDQYATACGFDDVSEAGRDEAQRELLAVIDYVANNGGGQPPELSQYRMAEETAKHLEPLWWVVMVEVLLAVLVWGLVLRWVERGHARAWAGYALRHERLVEKLRGWIVESRAGMSMGSGVDGGS